MLELQPNIEYIALDRNPQRAKLIQENLTRLNLSAKVMTADAGDLTSWWDGNRFDRILLDAPCSASGVIRRHPEIKMLRKAEDIANLAKEQLRLLIALWQVLKTGGKLLYATCSIFPEENTQVIEQFLRTNPNAKVENLQLKVGRQDDLGGQQILPFEEYMDGFYYICLSK